MRNLTQNDFKQLLDKPVFRLLTRVADEQGAESYVVGGYVRDLFLDRPSSDIDIVVVGHGIGLATAFAHAAGRGAKLSVFRNYGTAQVKWKGMEIEFVGARRESYSHDSRNPVVEDGTMDDDQKRRDFTINALAVCLNKQRLGQLVDPFDGVGDLRRHTIRTPLDPDITFSDDPLRMMRCVRFATQLNFSIDDDTFQAIMNNRERIKIVSRERIGVELQKIVLSPTPSIGFVSLQLAGLLNIVFPELAKLDCVETRCGRSHKNNFYHSLQVLDNVARQTNGPTLRWAALLHDIGKTQSKRWDPQQGWTFHNHNYTGARMLPAIFSRLKLPIDRQEKKRIEKLVLLHMRPIAIADDEVTDSAVRRLMSEAGDDIDDLMTLCDADITSRNELKKQRFHDNFVKVRRKIADLKERDYKRLLQPVVDGNEIMQMFGLKPSAEVGRLKQFLKQKVLDNKVPNKREPLLELLKAKAAEMGLKPVANASKANSTAAHSDEKQA